MCHAVRYNCWHCRSVATHDHDSATTVETHQATLAQKGKSALQSIRIATQNRGQWWSDPAPNARFEQGCCAKPSRPPSAVRTVRQIKHDSKPQRIDHFSKGRLLDQGACVEFRFLTYNIERDGEYLQRSNGVHDHGDPIRDSILQFKYIENYKSQNKLPRMAMLYR